MTKIVLNLPKSIVRKLEALPAERSTEKIIGDILKVLCGEMKPAPSYMMLTVHPPYYPLGE
jgi:hypothetical protein